MAWRLWQIIDSAFPSGGFAHSGGLEAAWQHHRVRDADALRAWTAAALRQCCTTQLPLVAAGHRQPEQLAELDALGEAWTSNHVANRASRQQGRAFWMATELAFQLPRVPPPTHAHLAPLFGARCRQLELSPANTLQAFLYIQLRSTLSAAVRLGIVGPLRAQSLQHQLAATADALLQERPEPTLDDLAQTAPLLDAWQGTHDRLATRLFQS